MTYYSQKKVLITGAFGGFGKYFIKQLAAHGASLILSDRNLQTGQELLEATDIKSRVLALIEADLSTLEGCQKLFTACEKLQVFPDIIIHNAGIAFIGNYLDTPLELSEAVIHVNLISVMRLNKLFVPHMVAQKSGHLIYVSSVAGFVATPFGSSYSASKFAVKAFAMALHGEVRKHGIKTSITYPFWSKTAIMKSQVFGNPDMQTMPDFFASEPEAVVRTTLDEAAQGKLHINPGIFSNLMWMADRLFPVIAEQRHMDSKLIED